MRKILHKIKRSGFFELIYLVSSIFFMKLFSFLKVILLKLRGFDIDYSVEIGKNSYFFQSYKQSIIIEKNSVIGSGVRLKAGFKGKVRIGKNVLIDDYSFISSHDLIEIGAGTMIAAHSYIVDFNHKYPLKEEMISRETGYESKKIRIGSKVWIGTHSVILPGVIIGDEAVIGAGSVVTKNVPKRSIAVGNPARVIKKQ